MTTFVLLNIYPAFPKRGHTIHGCDLPLLHLLKLWFFPHRVSKSSSQMKWCYFMLKVKEKFYRQINFKLFLPFFANFEIWIYCCMVQCVETRAVNPDTLVLFLMTQGLRVCEVWRWKRAEEGPGGVSERYRSGGQSHQNQYCSQQKVNVFKQSNFPVVALNSCHNC